MTQDDDTVQGDGRTERRIKNTNKIYDAAMELFRDQQYADVGVAEICAHAGVGRATFFRIFESKGGLLKEFNRRLASRAQQRLLDENPAGVAEAFHLIRECVIEAWALQLPGQASMAKEFLQFSPAIDLHAPHRELLLLVTQQTAKAIESGELASDVPPELAAAVALGNICAPIAQVLAGNDMDIDQLSRVLLDQWLHGMQLGITTT